jgi:hypothetical protein
MSEPPIPDEAIEAATSDFRPSPNLNSEQNDEARSAYRAGVRRLLESAAPFIRADERKRVAAEIRSEKFTCAKPSRIDLLHDAGLEIAARLAAKRWTDKAAVNTGQKN